MDRRRSASSGSRPDTSPATRTPATRAQSAADGAEPIRCGWAGIAHLEYTAYHDTEWGVPLHDERALFELLCLEGAQAGLSWLTILRKREGYRKAFLSFDPQRVADMSDADLEQRLADPAIVRNRLKVNAVRTNARAFLEVQAEHGSFDSYLWNWVDGRPLRNAWREKGEIPAKTPLAESISRDLKKRGFSFVGPTIVYAYLQS